MSRDAKPWPGGGASTQQGWLVIGWVGFAWVPAGLQLKRMGKDIGCVPSAHASLFPGPRRSLCLLTIVLFSASYKKWRGKIRISLMWALEFLSMKWFKERLLQGKWRGLCPASCVVSRQAPGWAWSTSILVMAYTHCTLSSWELLSVTP